MACETPLPEALFLVGLEVKQCTRQGENIDKIVEKAAAISLEIARNGYVGEV